MENRVTTALKPRLTASTVAVARKRLLRMHYEAGVGHIGGNLSALDVLLVVFHEFLGDEDHFFLSKGHAAGALYIALWSVAKLQDPEYKKQFVEQLRAKWERRDYRNEGL